MKSARAAEVNDKAAADTNAAANIPRGLIIHYTPVPAC
jgi:hypothetical protein